MSYPGKGKGYQRRPGAGKGGKAAPSMLQRLNHCYRSVYEAYRHAGDDKEKMIDTAIADLICKVVHRTYMDHNSDRNVQQPPMNPLNQEQLTPDQIAAIVCDELKRDLGVEFDNEKAERLEELQSQMDAVASWTMNPKSTQRHRGNAKGEFYWSIKQAKDALQNNFDVMQDRVSWFANRCDVIDAEIAHLDEERRRPYAYWHWLFARQRKLYELLFTTAEWRNAFTANTNATDTDKVMCVSRALLVSEAWIEEKIVTENDELAARLNAKAECWEGMNFLLYRKTSSSETAEFYSQRAAHIASVEGMQRRLLCLPFIDDEDVEVNPSIFTPALRNSAIALAVAFERSLRPVADDIDRSARAGVRTIAVIARELLQIQSGQLLSLTGLTTNDIVTLRTKNLAWKLNDGSGAHREGFLSNQFFVVDSNSRIDLELPLAQVVEYFLCRSLMLDVMTAIWTERTILLLCSLTSSSMRYAHHSLIATRNKLTEIGLTFLIGVLSDTYIGNRNGPANRQEVNCLLGRIAPLFAYEARDENEETTLITEIDRLVAAADKFALAAPPPRKRIREGDPIIGQATTDVETLVKFAQSEVFSLGFEHTPFRFKPIFGIRDMGNWDAFERYAREEYNVLKAEAKMELNQYAVRGEEQYASEEVGKVATRIRNFVTDVEKAKYRRALLIHRTLERMVSGMLSPEEQREFGMYLMHISTTGERIPDVPNNAVLDRRLTNETFQIADFPLR